MISVWQGMRQMLVLKCAKLKDKEYTKMHQDFTQHWKKRKRLMDQVLSAVDL